MRNTTKTVSVLVGTVTNYEKTTHTSVFKESHKCTIISH
jgi:hypothetical protein